MSITTLILGEPGTGKSTSMRNMDPSQVLLIQTIKKPLPFRSPDWKYLTSENHQGNVYVCDDPNRIIAIMQKTRRKIVVIDDWNLCMTNSFMRRSSETGFQKFNDIGKSAWSLFTESSQLADDVRVYLLGHTEIDESGHVRAKTVGRMISEKCPVECFFTIVLRTMRINGNYLFSTQNSGADTTKAPIGMFDSETIDNDLLMVDETIKNYYNIQESQNVT